MNAEGIEANIFQPPHFYEVFRESLAKALRDTFRLMVALQEEAWREALAQAAFL